ncbi:MAG: flagellar biosynthesis protein FlhB [Candidatus Methylomirabilia bacterium]
MADDLERTEAPTPRRLEEARKKGQIAKSTELNSALLILGAAGFLTWAGPEWGRRLTDLIPTLLVRIQLRGWHPAAIHDFGREVVGLFLGIVLPPMIVLAVVAVGVNILQVGFLFTTKPLEPKLAKLNPINGLKRLFGTQALFNLLKAPVKLAMIGGVAFLTIEPRIPELISLTARDPRVAVGLIVSLVLTLFWRVGIAYLVLAVLDYAYQHRSQLRSLRMSRHEIKDEMRQAEGDPHTRARSRSLHRQYARRRMMGEVPKADVVVTNPVHVAVALKYERAMMRAPKVVAKGARLIAQQIKERARAVGVPVVEHPPLAQALYKSVPLGGEIPASLYRAVAEVLAYVFMLSQRQGRTAS